MQNEIEYKKDVQACAGDATLTSEQGKNPSKLGYNLYLIGQVWVVVLRAILVGTKTCFIPTVNAAAPKVPERPKPMRYKDLPMYDCPHLEFKEHIVKEEKCPNMHQKLIHSALHPHVSALRQEVAKNLDMVKSELVATYNDVNKDFEAAEKSLKGYMRHPSNETTRHIVMVVGTAAGFWFGGGGGIPRRIFMTGLGTAAAGSLCFPKETDEGVRTLFYYASEGLVSIYNMYCGKCFGFRKRVPCAKDLPEIPPPIPKYKMNCPKK